MSEQIKSPIGGGWRGHINGHIEKTKSTIAVDKVTLTLDYKTAWALCNQLTDGAISRACAVEGEQVEMLSSVGAALGRIIDHGSANNGGRSVVK